MPIPGDPDALMVAARDLAGSARALESVRDALTAHGQVATADWSGLAAPLAAAHVEQDARDALRVADVAARVVGPLTTYADELRSAQQECLRGEEMLAGASTADAAPAIIRAAHERALVASDTAARALDAASTSLDGITPRPATPTAAAPSGSSILAEVGNATASLGNAALNNPLEVLAVAGGELLVAASAAGAPGGTALTATGAGAPVGVPLAGASAAGMATGAAIAGTGLISLALQAAGPDRVTPFQVDAASGADKPQNPTSGRILERSEPGRQPDVRQVEDDQNVRDLADDLMEGGTPLAREGYPGHWVTAPDGTEIGFREGSVSGGPTVDIKFPTGEVWKIHRR